MTNGAVRMPYRADVDGLRALAVLPVVLFHANVSGFSGGYVGVDVFFVISGYLITAIIRQEQSAGGYSVRSFYTRRIKRIIPALFVMMALVLVVGAVVLMPKDYAAASQSAAAASLFSSNIFFWRTGGYFDGPAEQKVFLHTWSLAVEEQFYIFFPLLLAATHRFIRRFEHQVLVLATLCSLILAVVGIQINKSLPTFFLLPTRAWELLLGSLLAIGFYPRMKSEACRGAVALAGLVLVLVPVALYSDRTPFPGLAAVPPCLGAALIIAAGAEGRHHLTWLLASKPMVGVGLISYSLYLWHWPIIVLTRYYLVRELTSFETAGVIAAGVFVAYLSWRFIEVPFRRRALGFGSLFTVFAAGAATFVAASVALTANMGWPSRYSPDVARINAVGGTMFKCSVTDYIPFKGYYACPLGVERRDFANIDVIIWGDSHAQMYTPAIDAVLAERGKSGLLIPVNDCPPLVDRSTSASCLRLNRSNARRITETSVRTVILAMHWENYDGRAYYLQAGMKEDHKFEVMLDGLVATVAELRAANKDVIIVGPIATPGYDLSSNLSRSMAYHRVSRQPLYAPRADLESRLEPVYSRLAMLRAAGVDVIYPDEAICSSTACPYMSEGVPIFADSNHLTAQFARSLAPLFRAYF
ncbi:acyltransferase family protein [Phenylobacterium sp. VNQ135]|uniref:acyltransferase family protein n=1 Tax=Phenylobacterium sp. VNQ135 TaxID=3400922 RepID=UPI003C07EEB5